MDPDETNDGVIEEEGGTQVTPTDDGNQGGGNADLEAQLAELQKQLDTAKANSRKWEKRAKSSVDETVAELRAELDAMKAEKVRSGLVNSVASELNVSREVLDKMSGDDEDAIRANATLLQTLTANIQPPKPAHPGVPDGGETHEPTVTRESIEAIKDPVARVREIARHRDLFEN